MSLPPPRSYAPELIDISPLSDLGSHQETSPTVVISEFIPPDTGLLPPPPPEFLDVEPMETQSTLGDSPLNEGARDNPWTEDGLEGTLSDPQETDKDFCTRLERLVHQL